MKLAAVAAGAILLAACADESTPWQSPPPPSVVAQIEDCLLTTDWADDFRAQLQPRLSQRVEVGILYYPSRDPESDGAVPLAVVYVGQVNGDWAEAEARAELQYETCEITPTDPGPGLQAGFLGVGFGDLWERELD